MQTGVDYRLLYACVSACATAYCTSHGSEAQHATGPPVAQHALARVQHLYEAALWLKTGIQRAPVY